MTDQIFFYQFYQVWFLTSFQQHTLKDNLYRPLQKYPTHNFILTYQSSSENMVKNIFYSHFPKNTQVQLYPNLNSLSDINFILPFSLQLQIQFSDHFLKSFYINSFMSTSFFSSFDCVNSSKTLLLKENDHTTTNAPQESSLGLSKLAYSLKDKKLVEKQLAPKQSLKSLKRSYTFNLGQKENIEETQNTKKQVKTLQIIREVAVQFQPTQKSVQIQTQPSLINRSQINIPSYASISVEDHLKSTQDMQLCGAQSVVLMQHMGLKKQISNQSTECKCQTGGNTSIILNRKENPEIKTLVRQGRSVSSFYELVQNSSKTTYTSVLVPGKLKCGKIDEEKSDNSQSLKNVNIYSHRNGYERPESQNVQKTTQNSSTFAMNNSMAQTFRSKILEKKKFDQMQVRSAESIKQEESVDEFSQVLSKSQFSNSSKKISLSGLILSKKFYHQQ